jgi:DNA-binding NarL/FixJ family response regulator
MDASSPNTVLVVDEEPIARLGVIRLLEVTGSLSLSGEAASPAEARQLCVERRPALALVDAEMNGGEGCALMREFRRLSPKTRVVAWLRTCDADWLQRVLQAGAMSCVARRDDTSLLAFALKSAVEGRSFLSPSAESLLIREIALGNMTRRQSPLDRLSERERQVFRLYGEGRSTREVSHALGMSVKTVETHALHIREKMQLRSLAELRQLAAQSARNALKQRNGRQRELN